MKRGFFLKFSLLNVLNSPSERVFYFVRRKYASFSLNFSLFVLMICLFVPFPLSGPASFGQFACLDLAPLVSFGLSLSWVISFCGVLQGFHHHFTLIQRRRTSSLQGTMERTIFLGLLPDLTIVQNP